MADEDLFLDDQHPGSLRFVEFADNGTSAWLYLTEPETGRIVRDVWVYNRIPAPPTSAISSYRGGPPPAAIGYASPSALCHSPSDHEWAFQWSNDGEAVALIKDGIPVAFVQAEVKVGYSRELVKDGPWGNAWSDQVFQTVFPDSP